MPRIPSATLSKLLARAGIIARTQTDDGRVSYAPTQSGAELYDVLYGLGVWGERWIRHIITDDAVATARVAATNGAGDGESPSRIPRANFIP